VFLLFARSISLPLQKGVNFAEAVSSGDLTAAIDIHRGDEIGHVHAPVNRVLWIGVGARL
jgi:methyl-accepting chemotaxis protein